ncbi:MAG TPA: mannosyl-3-phosphoglycerate synthase [Micromonosporaceae bacterium]|nr:mannosyl-3-phosphoglycerate synthase [Micromonosporaceae bacterium]
MAGATYPEMSAVSDSIVTRTTYNGGSVPRMRLEHPHRTERFGAVHIRELQRVVELDSGEERLMRGADDLGPSCSVSTQAIRSIERDLVIVVPCMNETRKVIEGVLAGIPHDCLIILVSNSDRQPVDRYAMEVESVEQFCRFAERPAITIHQRDPGLAAALKAAGMPEIVDDDGLVRRGKGEAMLVGMALASLSGRSYIGYVDADNYVPGAVNEYCKAYAAGLHLADSPFGMVRISWGSKPKLRDGRVFYSRHGRTSEITNRFLNRLVAEYSGFGTDLIATGNAGEHAFSLELGLRMRMAGGYAVEPYQFIDLFEQFGGVLEPSHPDVMASTVPVVQIESRNPHFHEDKGEEHIHGMRTQALNVIYHSAVCLPEVRTAIQEFLVAEGAIEPGAEPPMERIYPPVGVLAIDLFFDVLKAEATSLRQVWRQLPDGLHTVYPTDRLGSAHNRAVAASWQE